MTRHPDGCLMLYPRPVWIENRAKLAALPFSARFYTRILLGSALDVDMDGTGRILISPELRTAAGLAKEVMLLGMGSHFEIWDAATLAAKEREAIEAGTPESIANFNF